MMKINPTLLFGLATVQVLLLMAVTLPAGAQQLSAAERAAAVKATLEASQIILRQYEWVETTVVSVNGDEKSRKQERCYYGADGNLTKVTLSQSAPQPKPRGFLRSRIAEKKQEELTDYMTRAISLVKAYFPTSPAKIQMVKDAGGVSLDMLDPGKRARLNLRGYEKSGDTLALEVDLTNNRPVAAKVSTYLEDAKDVVTLDVTMGRLNDGTTYPSDITLQAQAKKLTVTVQNSGYRKSGQ